MKKFLIIATILFLTAFSFVPVFAVEDVLNPDVDLSKNPLPSFSNLGNKVVNADISCSQFQYPWCNVKGIGGSGGLVNQFYNYALAAVGVAALGAIIYGGILYTMSAGNPSGQQEAISWITGAVYGLILLLGANLLLRTINPQLVKLELTSLKEVNLPSSIEPYSGLSSVSQPYDTPSEILKSETAKDKERAKALTECSRNCRSVSQHSELRLKNGACQGNNCYLEPTFMTKLASLSTGSNNYFYKNEDWQITEAWPPTVKHSNICHYNATCVDANFLSGTSPTSEKISNFINQASIEGLKAVYEVKTQSEKDALVKSGVSEKNIDVVSWITGSHFSIYNK